MTSHRRIEQIASNLLGATPVLPIQIELIIENQKIKILPYDMADGISGILMIEKGNTTIGYAKKENVARQRFTMAHELGHFMLHQDCDLFVDKDFKATMYRPSSNTPSTQWQEWEANEFAACILMPASCVREEVSKIEIDYEDDKWIDDLAEKFKVSRSAMSIRISKLGLK